MIRCAITIVYNGLHHLRHKQFTEFMVGTFDYWIIVEGHSRPGGSTNWCKTIKVPANSTDGTCEYIKQLAADHGNVISYSHHKYYQSKDEQFNKALVLLSTKTKSCYLWQVDVDEHWKYEDIKQAERTLWRSYLNVANFQFNHYVKKIINSEGETEYIMAVGDWGGGRVNRLWKWKGQRFESHEPAVMLGQTRDVLELPQKFDHYSLTDEKDVRLKSKYYKGHEMLYPNWRKLDTLTYPVHISALFGHNNNIGRSNSQLIKINPSCVNVQNPADQSVKITC